MVLTEPMMSPAAGGHRRLTRRALEHDLAGQEQPQRGRRRFGEEHRSRRHRDRRGDRRDMLHLVGGDAPEERHVLQREDAVDGRQPPVASCASSRAALVGCTGLSGSSDRSASVAEEAADEVGVVGEERPQLLDGQRERHRRAAGAVRLGHRQARHRFDEPQRRRRVDD